MERAPEIIEITPQMIVSLYPGGSRYVQESIDQIMRYLERAPIPISHRRKEVARRQILVPSGMARWRLPLEIVGSKHTGHLPGTGGYQHELIIHYYATTVQHVERMIMVPELTFRRCVIHPHELLRLTRLTALVLDNVGYLPPTARIEGAITHIDDVLCVLNQVKEPHHDAIHSIEALGVSISGINWIENYSMVGVLTLNFQDRLAGDLQSNEWRTIKDQLRQIPTNNVVKLILIDYPYKDMSLFSVSEGLQTIEFRTYSGAYLEGENLPVSLEEIRAVFPGLKDQN